MIRKGVKRFSEKIMPQKSKSKLDCRNSADALPGLAAAEHAAESAALDLEQVRSPHRDRGVVILAAVGVVDAAAPLRPFGLHVDQDAFAVLDGIAAQIGAALLDADIALVFFSRPHAEWRVRGLQRRGGNGGGRSRR